MIKVDLFPLENFQGNPVSFDQTFNAGHGGDTSLQFNPRSLKIAGDGTWAIFDFGRDYHLEIQSLSGKTVCLTDLGEMPRWSGNLFSGTGETWGDGLPSLRFADVAFKGDDWATRVFSTGKLEGPVVQQIFDAVNKLIPVIEILIKVI